MNFYGGPSPAIETLNIKIIDERRNSKIKFDETPVKRVARKLKPTGFQLVRGSNPRISNQAGVKLIRPMSGKQYKPTYHLNHVLATSVTSRDVKAIE